MGYIQTYPICDPISGVIELIADARFDGAILVNQEGKRFVEELERRDVISNAILKQPGAYCYVLWNDNIGKISNTVKIHDTEYKTFTKQGIMHTSDTLKGAADYFHIPYANLKATVDRVSQMAKDGGKDLDFHNRGGLKDLSTGKYYIIKAVPSTHHTMGGLKINTKAEVLDKTASRFRASLQPVKSQVRPTVPTVSAAMLIQTSWSSAVSLATVPLLKQKPANSQLY